MKGSAPKTSRTGSHTLETMKPNPNLWRLALEASVICSAMASSVSTTTTANRPVNTRKTESPQLASRPTRASHLGRGRTSEVLDLDAMASTPNPGHAMARPGFVDFAEKTDYLSRGLPFALSIFRRASICFTTESGSGA